MRRPAACRRRSTVAAGGESELGNPEDVDPLFDLGEVGVAGEQGSFAGEGQGGREAVAIVEFVIGEELRGDVCQGEVDIDDFNGKLLDILDSFECDTWASGAPSRVIHFAPVDHGHEQFALAFSGQTDEIFNLVGAGAGFEERRRSGRSANVSKEARESVIEKGTEGAGKLVSRE